MAENAGPDAGSRASHTFRQVRARRAPGAPTRSVFRKEVHGLATLMSDLRGEPTLLSAGPGLRRDHQRASSQAFTGIARRISRGPLLATLSADPIPLT